ncbi:MAG: hypothetical protein JRJ12_06170 [Deltaproteobacteria bacterium]|nr:hypothetical protein [Deltaproteobacteria bacterium]
MNLKRRFKHELKQFFAPGAVLQERYVAFRELLEIDRNSHELIAELEHIYHDQLQVDFAAVAAKCTELRLRVGQLIETTARTCPNIYGPLKKRFREIDSSLHLALQERSTSIKGTFTLPLKEIPPDSEALAGGKARQLAQAGFTLGLPVPEGFVITTSSYSHLVECNELRPQIDEILARLDIESPSSLYAASERLQQLMVEASVPEAVQEAIHAAAAMSGHAETRFAVRSSAVGEDSRASFAGQYGSVLNVTADHLLEAYRRVLLSKYSPRALSYRIRYGLSDQETAMAVLVLRMIDSKASGVLYTLDPQDPGSNTMVLYVVWGLGELLVDGRVTPTVITVSRQRPYAVINRETAVQPMQAVAAKGEGTVMVPLHEEYGSKVPLGSEAIQRLLEWGLRLEKHQGGARDMEWCMDQSDELYLLQTRPLHLAEVPARVLECTQIEVEHEVLLSTGIRACSGIGAGRVFNVKSQDPGVLPQGTVLVAPSPSPDYVGMISRLSAVVTDVGSTAGHFASVAREFGVPTLVNTVEATERLTHGSEVTVYADQAVVYRGIVAQLMDGTCVARTMLGGSPLSEKLGDMLQYISPLHLLDPASDAFAANECKSLHDILRFAHEKTVQEMFRSGGRGGRRARGARKLLSSIPIAVYLVDLGGGFQETTRGRKEIAPAEVSSMPFQAVWRGLTSPRIYWDSKIVHGDWRAAGAADTAGRSTASYAVVSGDYLNFNVHFGYHFVVVDALCTEIPESNYILLRYAGGGGQPYSRFLRVKFLEKILSRHGFAVDVTGDLIEAQLARQDFATTAEKLELVGTLLGATRVLDMVLQDGAQVEEMVERFLRGDYNLSPLGKQ